MNERDGFERMMLVFIEQESETKIKVWAQHSDYRALSQSSEHHWIHRRITLVKAETSPQIHQMQPFLSQ
jgi:hypothetical protein